MMQIVGGEHYNEVKSFGGELYKGCESLVGSFML
jgi:hypothetical protein